MPRRREIPERIPAPDPIYNSTLVSKFINNLMWDGKKSLASKIFYDAMKMVTERGDDEPLKLFKRPLRTASRSLSQVAARGRSELQCRSVPTSWRNSLAMRWLIGYARGRSEKGMAESWPPRFWKPPPGAAPR